MAVEVIGDETRATIPFHFEDCFSERQVMKNLKLFFVILLLLAANGL